MDLLDSIQATMDSLEQELIQKHFEKEYVYDVLHVTELLALAFGHEPDEFGLSTHLQYMQRKSQPAWEKLGMTN